MSAFLSLHMMRPEIQAVIALSKAPGQNLAANVYVKAQTSDSHWAIQYEVSYDKIEGGEVVSYNYQTACGREVVRFINEIITEKGTK